MTINGGIISALYEFMRYSFCSIKSNSTLSRLYFVHIYSKKDKNNSLSVPFCRVSSKLTMQLYQAKYISVMDKFWKLILIEVLKLT